MCLSVSDITGPSSSVREASVSFRFSSFSFTNTDTSWLPPPVIYRKGRQDDESFVVGHKLVSGNVCHDLLLKFGVRKPDRVKIMKPLGWTLLDEVENLFRSFWTHRLGVSDGLFQVLGHSIRVKTQSKFQVPQFQGSELHACQVELLYITYFHTSRTQTSTHHFGKSETKKKKTVRCFSLTGSVSWNKYIISF